MRLFGVAPRCEVKACPLPSLWTPYKSSNHTEQLANARFLGDIVTPGGNKSRYTRLYWKNKWRNTKASVWVYLILLFHSILYCKVVDFDINYLHFLAKEQIDILREDKQRARERDLHAHSIIKYGVTKSRADSVFWLLGGRVRDKGYWAHLSLITIVQAARKEKRQVNYLKFPLAAS